MSIAKPFNLKNWIDEHRHLLKPPVGNQQIFNANHDFIVMVVGGPNARKDFHYNEGEELFYQLEGTINVKLMVDGKAENMFLNEGDMFLLPPKTLHCPQRPANTIGLVIERYREKEERDGFFWFCENCDYKLYDEFVEVKDIVTQLPVVMDRFYSSKDLCTCKECGTVMERPGKVN